MEKEFVVVLVYSQVSAVVARSSIVVGKGKTWLYSVEEFQNIRLVRSGKCKSRKCSFVDARCVIFCRRRGSALCG